MALPAAHYQLLKYSDIIFIFVLLLQQLND